MATKKAATNKRASKTSESKPAAGKQSAAKTSVVQKSAAKKGSGRKYSPAASLSVEREMKSFKQGTLKSGSGQNVTNPKQAIAIGLSEARRAGKKVPVPKK